LPYFVWEAAGRSLVIALSATILCLLLAAPLCTRGGEMIGTLGIAISPLVLGTGLFLILRPYINPFDVALLVTIFVNAVMSLPFVLRILRPQVETIHADYKRLSSSLGFTSIDFLRWVLLPRLKRPLAFAAGLSAARSMGDLGVIAFFGDAENATLPLELYQLMGSYRMEHASAAAGLDVIDVPYLDLDDPEGMRVEAERVRDLGFSGKGSVHPKQIAALNEVFTPSQAKISRARRIISEFETANTGLVVIDGKLIEKPVLRDMYRIVAIADRMGI